jgi:hypothetical protein
MKYISMKSKLLYDWQSVSHSVSQYVLVSGTPLGTMTRFYFCQRIALLFVLGRPLWREDGSVICSAISQWWESRRTHKHTLLCHLSLWVPFPSPLTTRRDYGGSILTRLYTGTLWREDGSVICSAICQWSESRRTHNITVSSETTGLSFRRLLRLAGITVEVFLPAYTRGGHASGDTPRTRTLVTINELASAALLR